MAVCFRKTSQSTCLSSVNLRRESPHNHRCNWSWTPARRNWMWALQRKRTRVSVDSISNYCMEGSYTGRMDLSAIDHCMIYLKKISHTYCKLKKNDRNRFSIRIYVVGKFVFGLGFLFSMFIDWLFIIIIQGHPTKHFSCRRRNVVLTL